MTKLKSVIIINETPIRTTEHMSYDIHYMVINRVYHRIWESIDWEIIMKIQSRNKHIDLS